MPETLIEECEENKRFQREIEILDGLNKEKQVIPKNYLCRIGHDLHGHFDPHHVDFEVLCGTVHTEKAAIFFPYLLGLFMFGSIVFFVTSQMYYFLPMGMINMPFLVLLRYAIVHKDHRKMIPFLVFTLIQGVTWLGIIIFLCVVVFYPHIPAYLLVKSMCETDVVGFQMGVLLIVLILAIEFFIMAYVNWNILFHFVYLMHGNTNSCCHTHDCPGKKDVDPNWHRKTRKPIDDPFQAA